MKTNWLRDQLGCAVCSIVEEKRCGSLLTPFLFTLFFAVIIVALCRQAAADVLQYDDGSWDLREWAQKDAAVRFTPGQELHLYSISAYMCYAPPYGSQFPVTVTVWSDNSGSMGSVLYSNQVSNWVGVPDTWNTFNIGLDFSPGQSFWAGFTSNPSPSSNFSFGLFTDTPNSSGRSYYELAYSGNWVAADGNR